MTTEIDVNKIHPGSLKVEHDVNANDPHPASLPANPQKNKQCGGSKYKTQYIFNKTFYANFF